MAGHPEELPLLGGVAALLGAPPWIELGGAGSCRVVSAEGLVAKIGPADVVEREAALLTRPLPLSTPLLVDSGPGWLVMTAEPDDDRPWTDRQLDDALGDLARLHDQFEAAVAEFPGATLRAPFTPDGADRLLEPVRRLGFALPAPLDRLLADPAPLLEAAAAEPATLLHGDPWPGNILRPAPGRRLWIDWECASIGPGAADVASWVNQTPWHPGVGRRPGRPPGRDVDVYLAARSRPVDRPAFERAAHAATVLWFLAYDVPQLPARST